MTFRFQFCHGVELSLQKKKKKKEQMDVIGKYMCAARHGSSRRVCVEVCVEVHGAVVRWNLARDER